MCAKRAGDFFFCLEISQIGATVGKQLQLLQRPFLFSIKKGLRTLTWTTRRRELSLTASSEAILDYPIFAVTSLLCNRSFKPRARIQTIQHLQMCFSNDFRSSSKYANTLKWYEHLISHRKHLSVFVFRPDSPLDVPLAKHTPEISLLWKYFWNAYRKMSWWSISLSWIVLVSGICKWV